MGRGAQKPGEEELKCHKKGVQVLKLELTSITEKVLSQSSCHLFLGEIQREKVIKVKSCLAAGKESNH